MENEKMETQTKEKKQQDMEAAVQADIVGMYPDNPEHLYRKMALEFYACDPQEKTLTLRWPVQDWELNHMSTMHGGLIAASIDTTSGALVRNLTGCKVTPTINLNINYLLPATAGDALLVTAKADRIGRHLANIHTECRSQNTGKLVAAAMVNFMLAD